MVRRHEVRHHTVHRRTPLQVRLDMDLVQALVIPEIQTVIQRDQGPMDSEVHQVDTQEDQVLMDMELRQVATRQDRVPVDAELR